MADPIYQLQENPEYNEAIRAIQDSDPALASAAFTPLFTAMLNNTHFVKLLAEELEKRKANLVDGKVPLEELPPLNFDPAGTAERVTGVHDNSAAAHTDIREAAAAAQAAAEEARAIAEGRSRGVSFASYETMAAALNAAEKGAYKMGDNFFIQTVGVPDLWVSSVEAAKVPYTFTTEQAFINALYIAGTLQIGYFKVCELETRKVDLSGYVQKTRKINGKTLAGDITLAAADVGARADTWVPGWGDVTGKPGTFPPSGHTHAPADLTSPVPLNKGGTGAASAAAARTALGACAAFGPVVVTVDVGSWSGSGPWTQTVSVAGVTAADNGIGVYPVDVADADARKLYETAYGCLAAEAETVAGGVKLTCRDAKPETSFQIKVQGVR